MNMPELTEAKLPKTINEALKILAYNEDKSLILIENFGNNTFNRTLNSKISEIKLYKRAVDALLEIHKNDLPKNIPVYSKDILMKEVNLFIEWYCNYKNINLQSNLNFKLQKCVFLNLPTQYLSNTTTGQIIECFYVFWRFY